MTHEEQLLRMTLSALVQRWERTSSHHLRQSEIFSEFARELRERMEERPGHELHATTDTVESIAESTAASVEEVQREPPLISAHRIASEAWAHYEAVNTEMRECVDKHKAIVEPARDAYRAAFHEFSDLANKSVGPGI